MSVGRISSNIVTTYLQNFISIVLALYSTRWVFGALGEEQFGLFALVGSLIAFAGTLGSIMVGASCRFFNIAIGQEQKDPQIKSQHHLNKWFNTILSVNITLAIVLCTIMFPIGEHLVRYKLEFPRELLHSALIVYRISLLSTFFTIATTPFVSIYTSKQLIFVRNFVGILQTILCFFAAYYLLHFSGNKLVLHSVLTFSILMLTYVIFTVGALKKFPECKIRLKYWFEKSKLIELFTYTGFMIYGVIGNILATSGVAVVLNLFCGTIANTMIGIGHQVSSKLNILANSISNAVAPEIMTRYGKDDKIGAISLGCDLCLYASVLSLFIFFPIYFWMPQILDLWLQDPPPRTSIVIYIMLIDMLLINLTSGFMNLVHATGKIKAYQFTLGTSIMLSVVILYVLLFFKFDFLLALAFAWILPHSFNAISRVYFAKKLLDVPITMYLKRVLIPFIIVLAISYLVCFYSFMISTSLISFIICGIINAVFVAITTFALMGSERRKKIFTTITQKFTKAK